MLFCAECAILKYLSVHFAELLYSLCFHTGLFVQYMEQEGVMPLLQCWLDLDSFQQLLASRQGCYDGLEAQNDAMVIYDK